MNKLLFVFMPKNALNLRKNPFYSKAFLFSTEIHLYSVRTDRATTH